MLLHAGDRTAGESRGAGQAGGQQKQAALKREGGFGHARVLFGSRVRARAVTLAQACKNVLSNAEVSGNMSARVALNPCGPPFTPQEDATMAHADPSDAAPASFVAFGLRAEAEPIAPGLHVVATPIGNLRDITLRALGTLAAADAVLAEDTRVSRHLLAHYGIATTLIAYH